MAARARQQDNGPADPQATNFCRGIPTILTEGCAHVHVCVFGARTRAIARLDEAGRQQRPAAVLRSHARWAKKIDQSFRANVFGARFYGNATYRAGGATRITSAVTLVMGAILAVPFFRLRPSSSVCGFATVRKAVFGRRHTRGKATFGIVRRLAQHLGSAHGALRAATKWLSPVGLDPATNRCSVAGHWMDWGQLR